MHRWCVCGRPREMHTPLLLRWRLPRVNCSWLIELLSGRRRATVGSIGGAALTLLAGCAAPPPPPVWPSPYAPPPPYVPPIPDAETHVSPYGDPSVIEQGSALPPPVYRHHRSRPPDDDTSPEPLPSGETGIVSSVERWLAPTPQPSRVDPPSPNQGPIDINSTPPPGFASPDDACVGAWRICHFFQ
jgi:hypothetical protein